MKTTIATDIVDDIVDSQVANLTDTQINPISTNSQEISVTLDEQPNAEVEKGTDNLGDDTLQGDEPKDQEPQPPEKTPEEIEAETKKAENDQKAQTVKMSTLEKRANEAEKRARLWEQAVDFEVDLTQNTDEALKSLVSNRAKFEEVKPYLAKKDPDWNISYEEFVDKLEQAYKQQSQVNPEAVYKANQVRIAQQQAQYQQEIQRKNIESELKFDLMADIPEFKNQIRNPTTRQQAETDLQDAIQIATIKFNRLTASGIEVDALNLIKEALTSLRPEWIVKKANIAQAKTQIKNALSDVLKNTAISSPTPTSSADMKLTAEQQTTYNQLVSWLVNQGNTEEQARAKATQSFK